MISKNTSWQILGIWVWIETPQSKALFVDGGDGSGEVLCFDKWQIVPMYMDVTVNFLFR